MQRVQVLQICMMVVLMQVVIMLLMLLVRVVVLEQGRGRNYVLAVLVMVVQRVFVLGHRSRSREILVGHFKVVIVGRRVRGGCGCAAAATGICAVVLSAVVMRLGR